jgi:hypothetical protein
LNLISSDANYLSVKNAIEDLKFDKQEDSGFDDLTIAEREQLKELSLYEMSISDLREATNLQAFYNSYQLQEEVDAKIASSINNLDDVAARNRLDQEVHEILTNEEKRQADSQIIMDSVIHDDSKSTNDIEDYVMLKSSPLIDSANSNSNCIVCANHITSKRYCETLPCGHVYCDNCITGWFERAVNDSTFLPLQCCKQPVKQPEYLLRKYLEYSKAEKLIMTMEEKECQNKMYCPNSSCSVFINLDKVEEYLGFDMNFECKICKTMICFNCHYHKHEKAITCDQNRFIEELNDSAAVEACKALGFQRCSKCKKFVELIYGCNHMTCTCKNEFCYNCGADWLPRGCNCELVDENRLLREQDEHIPANIVGNARANMLNQRVMNAREMIIAEENCSHHNSRRTDYSFRKNKPKCQLCDRRLNLFGYVCDCGLKKCIGCHLNR